MKILLVEDDQGIAGFIIRGLKEKGYSVDHTTNGEEGIGILESAHYDAVILDLMLPGMDGFSVIDYIRASGSDVPILILSARKTVDDRVKGLRKGGDDYLVKPFAMAELEVRLEVLTRRQNRSQLPEESEGIRIEDLELNWKTRRATRNGTIIELNPREFDLLNLLMSHPGQVITRTMILEQIWDYNFDPQTNVVDVLVSRLRSKVDKGFGKTCIQTIRGVGYSLRYEEK